MQSQSAGSKRLLIEMFRQMLRIRKVEERLIQLYNSGEVKSLMHLSTGQEAVAVGVCNVLRKEDSVVSTHRCHAHYLAKGGDLKKMFAELAGKVGGCSRGKGGSMHLFDATMGMNISVPIVGATIPFAVGIGQAISLKKEKRVSVAFFGDGAVEEGVFWESLNFASLAKLPVIFVCENNLYATHTHILKRQPQENIAPRVATHGLPSVIVDGNDVGEVYGETSIMVNRARQGLGPSFLEAKTYRWKEHWGPNDDWHLGYRSQEEGNNWKKRCPIQNLKRKISHNPLLVSLANFSDMEDAIEEEIEAAVNFAKFSPAPAAEELHQW